ncbi:putative metalloprotease CJM1_0395 family protein [Marinobacter sp. 1Y8]
MSVAFSPSSSSLYPGLTPSAGVSAVASSPGAATQPDDLLIDRPVSAKADAERPGTKSETDKTAGVQQDLEEAELQQLQSLKARDREVRAHEAAHQSVGGQHAGAASYSFERGPDGAQYAVSGEVPIDIAAVSNDPQATIDKMRVVQAAALAPAEPSSQDRQVAAKAMQIMLQAQVELTAEKSEGEKTLTDDDEDSEKTALTGTDDRRTSAYQSIADLENTEQLPGTLPFQATA